jgi:hypothetical protein
MCLFPLYTCLPSLYVPSLSIRAFPLYTCLPSLYVPSLWMRSFPLWMRSFPLWMRSFPLWMRSFPLWMRSFPLWMRAFGLAGTIFLLLIGSATPSFPRLTMRASESLLHHASGAQLLCQSIDFTTNVTAHRLVLLDSPGSFGFGLLPRTNAGARIAGYEGHRPLQLKVYDTVRMQ